VNEATARETPSRRPLGWVLLEFFGSMNLAITLLVVIAVASVDRHGFAAEPALSKLCPQIWAVLVRGVPLAGLYDVYGAGWFVGILAFLILSTSVCLYRQVPGMLREMTRFRTQRPGPIRCAVFTSTPSGGCRIAASTPRRAR
jgi:cytochrome c biogenesis protein